MSDSFLQKTKILPRPENYFEGLDWRSEVLPRDVLCFARTSQDHRTDGWEGISAKAGRYDQHARYVLLVALAGDGRVGIESEVCDLRAGEVILLRPLQIHYYVELPEEFCWFYVTFGLDRELSEFPSGPRPFVTALSGQLEKFLDLYEKEDSLNASSSLGKIVGAVAQTAVRPNKAKLSEGGTLVARVKEYVMGDLSGDLSLEKLAKIAELSESHLRAIFREETGVSLGHFVKSVRLVQATYLITEGVELPEVAKQSGFKSLTSFTRAFRRMYNMTPSEFRGKKKR
ncbi:MAG: AraC family transcriptional regulator [Akkermansiaceae bacterium]|nr:AraC family transcriptional regulator [Akkermansiaceae bacterium]